MADDLPTSPPGYVSPPTASGHSSLPPLPNRMKIPLPPKGKKDRAAFFWNCSRERRGRSRLSVPQIITSLLPIYYLYHSLIRRLRRVRGSEELVIQTTCGLFWGRVTIKTIIILSFCLEIDLFLFMI
ncbi:uncharacterized protein B0J16DRAFT_9543 [Fusarium flagelliforme]|uniref:uncharacterized protein n=1 Tax=Fusarium flagelliforme TaxID=2675880 RepID=UPI001E8D9BB7|nr:uncharacterized protein B0J16DRAFT_9543 [Fusarium flagelliforme]KAH7196953.1 hypothetical protein B0J16DRAFT_9543 [Fusarium flagelliforme]